MGMEASRERASAGSLLEWPCAHAHDDHSIRVAAAFARRRLACFDANKTLRADKWSARTKMALCATSNFMLGEVTAPWSFWQAKVFHELNASSVDLFASGFV